MTISHTLILGLSDFACICIIDTNQKNLYVATVFEKIFPSRFVVSMSDCGIVILYIFIPMMSCNTEFSTMGTSASGRWRVPHCPYRLICLIHVSYIHFSLFFSQCPVLLLPTRIMNPSFFSSPRRRFTVASDAPMIAAYSA